MEGISVYCADIGSVARRRFGWASEPSIVDVDSTDIRELARSVAAELGGGRKVALGLECPLFVPITDDPTNLTSAREGEGSRPWSAVAGSGVLATGLTETVWILREIRRLLGARVPVYLSWREFAIVNRGMLVWEAFVSSKAKQKSHAEDARAGVRAFVAKVTGGDVESDVRGAEVHSLIGAALIRTGWSDDVALLQASCLVVKAPHSM